MNYYKPTHVYIEEAARSKSRTDHILKNLQGIPLTVIRNRHELLQQMKTHPDPYGAGKKTLLLAYDEGETLKPFRESQQYLSCDYFTIHAEEGCDLECSYCFLQTHLTQPYLTVYTHLDEMLEKLGRFLNDNPRQLFRIGTGQLTDSLSLDHITAYSETFIPFFAKQTNATLELKTKSDNIERLLALDPNGKTIVSWSLNSKKIQREEEHKCASIEERIRAAKRIAETSSYRVGFHFDPIIDYAGWEDDYQEVVDLLFQEIPAERIAWISMGCFRGDAKLKKAVQERFPKSRIPLGEWSKGLDGKIRLFKPNRIAVYQQMMSFIQKHSAATTLYLSMESAEVWQKVFGKRFTKETVCAMLDETAFQKPLDPSLHSG